MRVEIEIITDPFGTDFEEGIRLNVQSSGRSDGRCRSGREWTGLSLWRRCQAKLVELESKNSIKLENESLGAINWSPVQRRATWELCFVPEQRHGHAAIKEINLIDNTLLTSSQNKNLVNKGYSSSFH